MKVRRDKHQINPEDREYPWIGVSVNPKTIVIFWEEQTGLVLESSDGGWIKGKVYDDFDMEEYVALQGDLILSND